MRARSRQLLPGPVPLVVALSCDLYDQAYYKFTLPVVEMQLAKGGTYLG